MRGIATAAQIAPGANLEEQVLQIEGDRVVLEPVMLVLGLPQSFPKKRLDCHGPSSESTPDVGRRTLDQRIVVQDLREAPARLEKLRDKRWTVVVVAIHDRGARAVIRRSGAKDDKETTRHRRRV